MSTRSSPLDPLWVEVLEKLVLIIWLKDCVQAFITIVRQGSKTVELGHLGEHAFVHQVLK